MNIVNCAHTPKTLLVAIGCSLLCIWSTKSRIDLDLNWRSIQQVSIAFLLFLIDTYIRFVVRQEIERHSSNAMLEVPIHIRIVSLPVHCLRLALNSSSAFSKWICNGAVFSFRTEEHPPDESNILKQRTSQTMIFFCIRLCRNAPTFNWMHISFSMG